MNTADEYYSLNKTSWNKRVQYHLNSKFYDMESFRLGKSSLNAPEIELLGNIKNKSVLHLQCHFGQDSISLSRLGAQVTGLDFSEIAIQNAEKIAQELKADTRFICCNLYDAPQHLEQKFDLVYTSYGTIGWLPDLSKWAQIIHSMLKPGGEFVIVDFHPVVWMLDYNFDKIAYRYFNSGPIIEESTGTYADPEAPISGTTVGWNHSLSEIVNTLIQNNLQIEILDEYDYSPHNCFKGAIESEAHKYRIQHLENKIPLLFAIKAKKGL